jgi:hypothetical protein
MTVAKTSCRDLANIHLHCKYLAREIEGLAATVFMTLDLSSTFYLFYVGNSSMKSSSFRYWKSCYVDPMVHIVPHSNIHQDAPVMVR